LKEGRPLHNSPFVFIRVYSWLVFSRFREKRLACFRFELLTGVRTMRITLLASTLSACLALGQAICFSDEASVGPDSQTDWHEGFETYEAGEPLSGQSPWQYGRPERGDEATALVVRDHAYEGSRAVAIFQDQPTNRVFSIGCKLPAQGAVVWVDAHIRPSRNPTAQPALDLRDGQDGVTHVGFAADGRNVVFSSFSRPYWRVFRDFPSGEARWYRLTQRIDFQTRTWSLWVDGKLHSCDLPLLAEGKQVTGIRITAGGTKEDPALVDGLYVGVRQPDGIEVGEAFPPIEPGHVFRFALFGDPQIGFGDRQPPHTRDVVRLKAAGGQAEAAGCELVLCCGDLVHQVADASTAGLLEAVETFQQTTWLPVPGNHDPDDWYQKHIRKELDYSIDHKGVTFIGMKTWAEGHQGRVTASQLAWLESRLRDAQHKGHETIIWCHVTPYGPNPRGWWVRDGQQEMLRLCRQYKALAVLAGHFHRELWHFELDGTHHVVAPGITLSRGELGWVVYDVYRDRVVQHFKPLWGNYTDRGESEGHVVQGPMTFFRHAPASAASAR
jgi:hypothetical protein